MAEALKLRGVYQHVGGRAALCGIDLALGEGEWLLVAGPNGAGKSLLMRLILGLDRPSAGTIRVLGEDILTLGFGAMRGLRGRIGAVLQGGSLLAGLSVLDNLLLPLRNMPWDAERLAREARLALTLLRLDGLENHSPRALSLGQRRRVELARALIHRPDLLVWDGLADGLDPAGIREILELLGGLRLGRRLSLIATDNGTSALGAACDRIAVLEGGRIAFLGTASELDSALPTRLDLRYVLKGRV